MTLNFIKQILHMNTENKQTNEEKDMLNQLQDASKEVEQLKKILDIDAQTAMDNLLTPFETSPVQAILTNHKRSTIPQLNEFENLELAVSKIIETKQLEKPESFQKVIKRLHSDLENANKAYTIIEDTNKLQAFHSAMSMSEKQVSLMNISLEQIKDKRLLVKELQNNRESVLIEMEKIGFIMTQIYDIPYPHTNTLKTYYLRVGDISRSLSKKYKNIDENLQILNIEICKSQGIVLTGGREKRLDAVNEPTSSLNSELFPIQGRQLKSHPTRTPKNVSFNLDNKQNQLKRIQDSKLSCISIVSNPYSNNYKSQELLFISPLIGVILSFVLVSSLGQKFDIGIKVSLKKLIMEYVDYYNIDRIPIEYAVD